MIPHVPGILVGYLNDNQDLVDLNVRVAVSTPAKFERPWVRVTWLDAPDRSFGLEHLIDNFVQFDCYAGSGDSGSLEASLIVRTVRQALTDLRAQTLDGVVVSDVRFVGQAYRPDTDLEPARPRFVLSAEIDMHPTTGGS